MKLFLCGDVMTGRGIDQVLAVPCDSAIDEPWVKDARDYVALAECAHGPIPRAAAPEYVWGDALEALEAERPDVRIVNLETAVTTSPERTPKGINYRMNPANVACLLAARIDCCVLANNHVLDWGARGLEETLDTLHGAGMRTAGAGRNAAEAAAPAILETRARGRVLVYAYGLESSGVPAAWAAGERRSGVSFLPDLSEASADAVARHVSDMKRAGDIAVVSMHWGPNWGYEVERERRAFAHRLVDAGAADLVHGHSAHHPGALELHHEHLILYACGDFLNDYEGIEGHESFHPDLVLMYLATLDEAGGALRELSMRPMRVRRFRLERAGEGDAEWLAATLRRVSGLDIERAQNNRLLLQ
ncbi:MAG: CapA family protein [Betaproteobacteria bacterium]|nr:CapA family protein [Betaproteobacteria bacterium]